MTSFCVQGGRGVKKVPKYACILIQSSLLENSDHSEICFCGQHSQQDRSYQVKGHEILSRRWCQKLCHLCLSQSCDFRIKSHEIKGNNTNESQGNKIKLHKLPDLSSAPAANNSSSPTGGEDMDILEMLGQSQSYPIDLKFGRPRATTNEKIVLTR